MEYERVCKRCGVGFATNDLRKIFCDKKCAFASHNAKRKTTKLDERQCTVCGKGFAPHQVRGVGRTTCSAECWKKHRAGWAKERRATTPSWREREIKSSFKRNYGITPEQYDAMLEAQSGVCKGCGREPKRIRLHVDHDHASGRVRGLLCNNCNRAIGLMKDDPAVARRLAEYLE